MYQSNRVMWPQSTAMTHPYEIVDSNHLVGDTDSEPALLHGLLGRIHSKHVEWPSLQHRIDLTFWETNLTKLEAVKVEVGYK